jgi:DeoR/GlpR family transcriptional regulator of sugar metabolism
MYGDKVEKQARLEQMAALVAQASEGVTQADLARALGVSRATIHKDLVQLEQKGVRLAEDDAGRLSMPTWGR